MPKVFISRRISKEAIDLLTPHAEVDAWQKEEAASREEVFRRIADKDALIVWLDRVDKEFLDHAPNVKVIAHRAAGFDNVDVEEATKRGIKVANSPRGVIEATADFAFGLLIAAGRQIVPAMKATYNGEWIIWDPMAVPFMGDDVSGKTLGIVGLGRIGSQVAKRARGFDMKVIYYDIVRNPREKELGAEYIPDLHKMLGMADFVSVHVPLNKQTRHIISTREFAAMKPTAILVNTSRGGTVDPKALYEALKGKKIQSAAIDVTEVEPIAPDDPLLTLDNLIITPHIAGGSKRARLEMDLLAAENIVAFLTGKPMPSCVNCDLPGK